MCIRDRVEGGGHRGVARLENTHTGLTYLEKDGITLKNDPPSPQQQDPCQEICGYTLKELCQYCLLYTSSRTPSPGMISPA